MAHVESSLFIKVLGVKIAIVLMYVDDLIITGVDDLIISRNASNKGEPDSSLSDERTWGT